MVKEIRNVENLSGIRLFESHLLRPGSGICLPGIGIFIHPDIPKQAKKRIIQHEFGHFLDYKFGLDGDRKRFLGSSILGFYIKIGIPSLFNLISGINKIHAFAGEHRFFWTELRANRLAIAHFGKSLAGDFKKHFPTE